jgi:hypothetical protein
VKPNRKPSRARRMSLARRLALILLVASAAAASAASPTALDVNIRTTRTMQAPRLVGDTLILTYWSREPARFVGARFYHEQGSILHVYSVNEYGVFVLDYPLPAGLERLRYRIEVDGLWMADPSNPLQEIDERGEEVSVYEVETEPQRSIVNPEITTVRTAVKKDGESTVYRATFVFRGTPGARVSLVGDFNGWDPFEPDYLMEEVRPGQFTITIPVRSGRHYYAYFAEGRKMLDEWNSETGIDPDGRRVNSFAVPYTRSD